MLKITEIEALPLKEIMPALDETLDDLKFDHIEIFETKTTALDYEGTDELLE
jgi:hypothetical protein